MNRQQLQNDKFDIDKHLSLFSNNIFFDQKTYREIKQDSCKLSKYFSRYRNNEQFHLEIKSPYLLLIALVALIQNGLRAALFPVNNFEGKKNIYFDQIDIENTIRDEDIEKILQEVSLASFSLKDIDIDAKFLILFTSGTSGSPKGILFTFGNIYYSCLGFNQYFNANHSHKTLLSLPFYHVSGLMPLWRSFLAGAEVTKTAKSLVNFISIVPTQLFKILNSKEETKWLKTISFPLVGGAFLSKELKEKALKEGIKLFETYGMTETSSLLTINGEILPYRKIEINQNNAVVVSGETLGAGYYQNKIYTPFEKSLTTKDVGKITDNKFVFIERSDQVFKSGGENINPIIIEDYLKNLNIFKQVFITSIPDEKWGEVSTILYSLNDQNEIDLEYISQQIQIQFPKFMVPKYYFHISKFSHVGIKPNRLLLKKIAYELYLNNIFPHEFKNNNSNKTIIFLHGFLGNQNDFKKIIDQLSNSINFLSIDLPGHGKSLAENFYSTEDFLKKLSHFIEIFTDNPIIYGYSMGGRIALELALKYTPSSHIILESAGLGLKDSHEREIRYASDRNLLKDFSSENLKFFLDHWYEQSIFYNYNKSLSYTSDLEQKLTHPILQWQKALDLLSPAKFPFLDENLNILKNSFIQIDYIYGEKDLKYKHFASVLSDLNKPNLVTHEISNCGHNPHKTQYNQIVTILRKALKL